MTKLSIKLHQAFCLLYMLTLGQSGFHALLAQSSPPSEHRQEITRTFQEYYAHLQAERYEEMIGYLYEPLFERMITKEAMLLQLRTRAQETPKRVYLDSSTVVSLSEIVQKKNTDYVLLKYINYMRTLVKLPEEDSTESQAEYSEFMLSLFEPVFGKENVRYDPQTLFIAIQSHSKMLCIRPEGQQAWKFVEMKPGQEKTLGKFIPSSVLKAYRD